MKNRLKFIYSSLMWVGVFLFIMSLFMTAATSGTARLIWGILIPVSVVFMVIFAFLADREGKKANSKKPTQTAKSKSENQPKIDFAALYKKKMEEFENQYKQINGEDYGKLGTVTFLNEDLKFSAKGKYFCEKDYNGVEGYHLAFNIYGTKLVETPPDYEDTLDYESVLFCIDIAYFDTIPLSDENDIGIIVKDPENLGGEKIELYNNQGYTFQIHTVETDEIDYGEIEIVEWNAKNKIINFKCVVGSGVNDIVYGKVKLELDTEEY